MSYPVYEHYKDSGIEWLGEIPAAWETMRLRSSAEVLSSNVDKKSVEGEIPVNLCNYTDVYYNDKITSEIEFMAATATKAEIERFKLNIGDVVITKDSETPDDIGVPTFIAENIEDLVCGYHLAILKGHENRLNGRYLFYVINSEFSSSQFEVAANGVTRFGLSYDAIKNVISIVPPLEEQKEIADFLDNKIDQIDALIEKKEKLLKLLAEKRTALITQAVTKGLDPTAPMKPSGIEWLGDVPTWWKKTALKRYLATPVTDGPHETPEILEEGIPFLSAEAVKSMKLDFSRKRGFISQADHEKYSKKYKPKLHDIYIVKSGATTGNTAIVETTDEFNIWSPLAAIRPNQQYLHPRFLFYYISSECFKIPIELGWSYGTQQNIGMNVIENLDILIPSLTEQEEIAQYLESKLLHFGETIKSVKLAIKKLKEYRSALITNAVTGKIKVS